MKLFSIFFIMLIFSSCFTTEYYENCPPLKWREGGNFTTDIELPGGHPYLSVGIRSNEKNNDLEKLKKMDVKCEIVNKGIDQLKISWIADNIEEKKNGEKIIVFDDGSEKRSILLGHGQKLLWYVGKMEKLLDTDFLTIQDYGKYTKHWNIFLRIEFKNPNKLKEAVNLSILEIPVSAYSSDNI